MTHPLTLRVLLVLAAISLCSGPAHAEDEPARPQVPSPLDQAAEQAAQRVLAAVKSEDDAAIAALPEQLRADPWLVADLLCFRGEHDAAARLAKAGSRADYRRLPAYVEAWRKRQPDEAERTLLDAMNAHVMSREAQKVLDGTTALPEAIDTVVRVRLQSTRGMALRVLEQWPEGRDALERTGDAALALGWLTRAQLSYEHAGHCARLAGDLPRAATIWSRQLEVIERRGDVNAQAFGSARLAEILEALGDPARALALRERAIPLFEAIGRKEIAAGLGNAVGIAYYRRGDYAKAMAHYQKALPFLETLGDAKALAGTLLNMAHVYSSWGEYARALSLYERALPLADSVQDLPTMANVLGGMGLLQEQQGEHAKGLETQERALALWKAVGDEAGIARTQGNIARGLVSLGQFTKALATFESAQAVMEKLGDTAGVLAMRADRGRVYQRFGDYAKALRIFERVLREQEALGRRAGVGQTLADLGIVHSLMGQHAKALGFMEQSLAAHEKAGSRHGVASALTNLGAVYKALGDSTTALSYFERAQGEYEALGDQNGLAGGLINIGNVHLDRGDPAAAITFYERGLQRAEAIGYRPWVVNALGNMSLAFLALGDLPNALAHYERGLAEAEAMQATDQVAAIKLGIGMVFARRGEHEAARKHFDQCARMATSLRATPLFIDAKTELARLYLDTGKPGLALGAAREALDATETMLGGLGEEEGATARAKFGDLYDLGALAAARAEDAASLLTFLDSGRAGALLDALGNPEVLRWKAESLPPDLRRRDLDAREAEQSARASYDRALERRDREATRAAAAELDAALERVKEVTARIQRDLKQQAGLFYPRASWIESVQKRLRADEALILYGLCRDEALALVLRRDDERIVLLGPAATVTAACERLDAANPAVDPTAALGVLRKLLVEPLKLEGDVKTLLVSPEGPLSYLPCGALFDRPVAMTPSGTTHDLLLGEERGKGAGILALGDPDYAGVSEGAQAVYYRGRTLSPLPSTRKEAEAIGTKTLLGAGASEEALEDALATTRHWRAVHFGCHGLVDVERPMQSSLALARGGDRDGFLTAREVLRMAIPSDLAVLSACETGIGKIVKGEGIVGLTRAFMFAGSPRVICSLWKVDDEATQALMVRFYELWNPKEGEGIPAAQALREAQTYVRGLEDENGKAKWAHPYYWAAWVLWGLPD